MTCVTGLPVIEWALTHPYEFVFECTTPIEWLFISSIVFFVVVTSWAFGYLDPIFRRWGAVERRLGIATGHAAIEDPEERRKAREDNPPRRLSPPWRE